MRLLTLSELLESCATIISLHFRRAQVDARSAASLRTPLCTHLRWSRSSSACQWNCFDVLPICTTCVKSLDFCWVHPLKLQAFWLGVSRNELVHVHESTTNATYQLIVHYFCVDFLGAKHVPAFTHSTNRDLTVFDTENICEHLIYTISLHSPVLKTFDCANFLALFDLDSRELNFVFELIPLVYHVFNLCLTLLDCFCDQLHFDIEIVECL